jgi:rubredoxin
MSKITPGKAGDAERFMLETGKLHAFYTIPMILHCPMCSERHIDEAEFAEVAHHTHACQGCGFVWRPAKVNTHGVRFLPGYSNLARGGSNEE